MASIKKIFNTTRETNAIFIKAGSAILKSSFNTAKEIFSLYRDAGTKAFKAGSGVVKKSIELTVENQKEIFKTSGDALKEAAQNVRDKRKVEAEQNKKARNTRKTKAKKEEVSIDDLLE